MSEHFIKNIEIKNFKCFENFKAEGFGRVNLIGGKNNVGKTAFMEACYLSQSEDTNSLLSRLLEIKTHRDIINNLLSNTSSESDFKNLIKDNKDIEIYIKGKGGEIINTTPEETYQSWNDGLIKINIEKKIAIYTKYTRLDDIPSIYSDGEEIYHEYPDTFTLSEIVNKLDLILDSSKFIFSKHFISPYSNSNKELEDIIGQSKLDNKYDELNKYLLDVFNVSSIDIIKNKPMLKVASEYRELSYFGQGIKTFINIISSMLLLKDDIIFIDEIENGIHYTNLDKLWEIILTISEDQNVQVFATTHSKECIESFNRVQKELKDENTYYFEMAKNIKTDKIFMFQMDSEQLEYGLSHNERLRGE